MSLERRDSWTQSDDDLLATTTLSYIRNCKTQLQAFEDVAVKLNRTQAACGFRWNSTIRYLYETEMIDAKRLKKETRGQRKVKPLIADIPLDDIINSLISIKQSFENLNQDNSSLHNKVKDLESKVSAPNEKVTTDEVKAMIKMLQIVTKEIQPKEMPKG
jgi:prespore-specific regulator